MRRIPAFFMGMINPAITGVASLAFVFENTAESLESIETGWQQPATIPQKKEDKPWLSYLNPFNLILQLTYQPLRYLLFLGHLVSIGVTTDRLPGLSKPGSAAIGFISEGIEDYHYFFGSHNHDHGDDLDSLLITRPG